MEGHLLMSQKELDRKRVMEHVLEGAYYPGRRRSCCKSAIARRCGSGRVERKHGVLQDRFVAELALAGIKTIETANKALKNAFLSTLNDKFAKPPLEPQDFHRPVPKNVELADIFCFETTRTLANDRTIRLKTAIARSARTTSPCHGPRRPLRDFFQDVSAMQAWH